MKARWKVLTSTPIKKVLLCFNGISMLLLIATLVYFVIAVDVLNSDFDKVVHTNEVKAVVLQRPWCLLNVDVNIRRTLCKIIGIDKPLALVKAAAEVEFSH